MWDIETLFERINKAAKKHGGKSWKPFVESNEFTKLLASLKEMPEQDALHLLEYFVRWVRAQNLTANNQENA